MGTMHNQPARPMYDQLEDALTSITMQLRTAIEADANQGHYEISGAPNAGNTVTVSLPMQRVP